MRDRCVYLRVADPGQCRRLIEALDDGCKTLTNTDAQTHCGVPSTAALQLSKRSDCNACTGCAERMTYGDCTTIGVNPAVSKINIEQLQSTQDLGGKRLVDFDDVHIIE